MKNILLLLFTFAATQTFAQRGSQEHRQKLESRRIAFLSDKLNFTPQEAQIFWPVYNEYTDALHKIRQTHRKTFENDFESEEQASSILEKTIKFEEDQLDLKKIYIVKIKKLIGAQKTLVLFRNERKFKEDVLKSMKERRRGR